MAEGALPDDVVRRKETGGKPNWAEARAANHGGMRPKKLPNKSLAVAERRLRMATMCADGMTLRAIGEDLGLSAVYVGEEINRLIDDLQRQALESIGRKVAREIAVLNMVQLEATLAWYESKEGREISVKRRSREIRSAFVNTSKSARHGAVKTPETGLGMTALDVQRKTRTSLRDLFADTPQAAFPDEAPDHAPDFGQNIVQLPIEREEEYTRTELSSGAAEFLRIILDCHEKRSRLLNLYNAEGGDGYENTWNLTPEQRKNRLLALVQDLRAARAIAEGHQLEAETGAGEPIPAQAENVRDAPVAVPVRPQNNGDSSGGPV